MAKKPNLGQINSSVFTVGQLNAAFTKIDNAFENTLSRDGSSPNNMLADLDMDSNDILNAGVLDGTSLNVDSATIGGKLFSGTIEWRSDWLTATNYKKLDLVRKDGVLYICLEEHTSDTFMTDLTNLKWELFISNTEGPQGPAGLDGSDGFGVPPGGTTGQVLAKIDNTDYNTQWVTGGGGGVTDGDKGDITVSASGATWTIDNSAVTLPKIVNISTNRLLGRTTAGTGQVEELTQTQARTLLNVENGAQVNVPTDLSYTAATRLLASSTGADVTLPLVGVDAGLMSSADKTKLDAISGTNTGDQTSIVGITGTKAQFDTAVTDGNFMYVGDAPTAHTHTLAAVTDVTITVANLNSLDDGVNSTLHFHNTDRDRANHTGTQTASTISDFSEAVDDRVAALAVAGTNMTITYNDVSNTLTFDAAGGGGGVSDGDKGDIVVSSSGTVWTVDAGVIDNTKLADVPARTLKGRASAGVGDPEDITVGQDRIVGRLTGGGILDLTGTQVTTLLDTFTTSLKGVVPASGGGTTNFLRADGTWAAPPGGGGGLSDGNYGEVTVSGSGTVIRVNPKVKFGLPLALSRRLQF